MYYVDTQLNIHHQVEEDFDPIGLENECQENKTIRDLNNLIELNYISLTENSLKLTQSGSDYFMRKCAVVSSTFELDKMAPTELQSLIFDTFFKGRTSLNSVEKFIKFNLKL